MVPALESLGRDWERGLASLSQVYMAGRICEQIMSEMLPAGQPSFHSGPRLAIGVLEDHHALGKRMVLSSLHSAGYHVQDYGCGRRAAELVEMALRDQVDVLLVSCLMLASAVHSGEVGGGFARGRQSGRGGGGRGSLQARSPALAGSGGAGRGEHLRRGGGHSPGLGGGKGVGLNSSQRLQEALSHREPDRVPYALAANLHPARYLGLGIKEYFYRPEYVVEGQLRLREKFGNDMLCCYPFAAVEMLAWGGEVIYYDEGPPNVGAPIIKRPEDILSLSPPRLAESAALRAVLEATAGLKAVVGDEVPIAGVAVSPFSLPIMQMGFEAYLDLIYERPDLLERLLEINLEYSLAWAQAQLEAGASAIVYSDPASSPTIMSRDIALRYGLPAAQEFISRIEGGVMIHLASGRGLGVGG